MTTTDVVVSMKDLCEGTSPYYVVLFYKYVAIDADEVAEWQRKMCAELGLIGRLLVAPEGMNGTLAGKGKQLHKYITSMSGDERFKDVDWKLSMAEEAPFPDMFVRRVKELIATGGSLPSLPFKPATRLPPQDFHKKLVEKRDEVVLLDVRNKPEYAIGHFEGAVDPKTRFFSEWTAYAAKHAEQWKDEGKTVMMYCTGGIRCEKASAFLKSKGINDVYHLSGGIHRYLEAYPNGGLFKGKNFVFDKRVAVGPKDAEVVGRCIDCDKPYDTLRGDVVCTVCRDTVVVCDRCQAIQRGVYYCDNHRTLKGLYFHNIETFTAEQLAEQLTGLKSLYSEIQVGVKFKNRRRTLKKQMDRISARIAELGAEAGAVGGGGGGGGGGGAGDAGDAGDTGADADAHKNKKPRQEGAALCRTCDKPDCGGNCWGFWADPDKVPGAAVKVPEAAATAMPVSA